MSVCKGLTGPCTVFTYEMEEMSEDHALQLFNRHAFGGERSPVNFAALSKQVVRTTGNLPLALEVIGGHLCGEDEDVWEYTLQKFEQVPDKDVMRTLLISYEGLEEREKQIFLDIACLSSVMPRRYANYMWEACGLYPNWGVAVLVNKSLVKVFDDDEFGMHDLIRDMGREIVCLQGLDCLGMRSRLFTPVDAMNVVRQKEGTNKVLAINMGQLSDEHHLACEEFEGMSNLRFLWLCGGQFIGDFRNFRTKLLWLNWNICERVLNPSFFNMYNLVVLEISGPGITDESMKDLRMGNLRALEICLSPMTKTPDLSHCSKLERIILQHCFRLKTFHSSVGKLGCLMSLNIESCKSLRSLPQEFGSAKALQELSLIDCKSIKELPESIGRLGALRVLRVRKTKIGKIPASIGNLKCLEVLEFGNCPLDIPDLSSLTNLTELVLNDYGTGLKGTSGGHSQPLPLPWIRKLHRLQRLDLLIPVLLSAELGCLSRLQELDLYSVDISSLSQFPSSLSCLRLSHLGTAVPWVRYSNLGFLLRLELYDSTLTEIQLGGLDKFVNLTSLTIEFCFNLEKLSDLSCMRKLSFLHLGVCPKLVDISGIEEMEMLEELTISSCNSLIRIPDLSDLTRLRSVRISFCHSLRQVPCMIDKCHLDVEYCLSIV